MPEIKKTCKNCGYRDESTGTCLLKKPCLDANYENSYMFWIDQNEIIERGVIIHPDTLKQIHELWKPAPPRLLTLEEVQALKPNDDIYVEYYDLPFVMADTVRNNMGSLISCMSSKNILVDKYLRYVRLWTSRPDKETQLATRWEKRNE